MSKEWHPFNINIVDKGICNCKDKFFISKIWQNVPLFQRKCFSCTLLALAYGPFSWNVRKRPVYVKRVKNDIKTWNNMTGSGVIASLIRSIDLKTHVGRLWSSPGYPPGWALVQWCPEAVSSGHVNECWVACGWVVGAEISLQMQHQLRAFSVWIINAIS